MNKIIAVDFDGTLCEDKWPEIGNPNLELFKYLKTEQAAGATIILWTCRAGQMLCDAVHFCMENGLIFDSVNRNRADMVKRFNNDSRKIYADEYIDDRNCTKFKLPFKMEEE